MEYNEFINNLKNNAKKINVDITDKQAIKFYEYMNVLLEWNEKINLTAITNPKDVIIKHFIDSITIEKYLPKDASIIDIGTGAGFPGIPVKIIRDDLSITLMDSLNKRINFLNEVIDKIDLQSIKAVHSRAEELAKNKQFREKYDVATSRAVAPLNVLLEYMLPFVKVGGYCICMKGSNIDEEVKNAKGALKILKGEIEEVQSFNLPESDYGRNIIIVKKLDNTPNAYPRKAGTPSKEPLV